MTTNTSGSSELKFMDKVRAAATAGSAVPPAQPQHPSGGAIPQRRQPVPNQPPSGGPPPRHSGGSGNGGTPINWDKIGWWVIALIGSVSTYYYVSHDTPDRRAKNELAWTMSQTEVEKTAQAKEVTKQMKIAAESGQTTFLQQNTPAVVVQNPAVIETGSQRILSIGGYYQVQGQGEGSKAANIILQGAPKQMTGSYMLVFEGRKAWSEGWSHDPSPENVTDFMASLVSKPGDIKIITVFSNGNTNFKL